MTMPRGVALYLAGATTRHRAGHVFHVHVEEGCGETAQLPGKTVEMLWLRAACSCGWRDDRRSTLEENAYSHWVGHVESGKDAKAVLRFAAGDGVVLNGHRLTVEDVLQWEDGTEWVYLGAPNGEPVLADWLPDPEPKGPPAQEMPEDKRLHQQRHIVEEIISGYSEARWCAGWAGDIEVELWQEPLVWRPIIATLMDLGVGWPMGHRGEHGWATTPEEFEAYVASGRR